MLIKVEQYQIDNGLPRSMCSCPVALAIERCTGRHIVEVSDEHVTIFEHGEFVNILLPLAAQEFIKRYDEGSPVEPFEFELEVAK